MRWVLAPLFAVALPAACAAPPAEPDGAAPVAAHTSIRLEVAPFPDFYFLVRAQAAGVVEADARLEPVVAAWMPVQEEIGTFGGFWRFDLAGLLSDSPTSFGAWFADAPESVPSRAGGEIPIRRPGLAMAEAMGAPWREFSVERWPARSAVLEEALAALMRDFLPRHREALRHMLESLRIEDPRIEVPMWLVHETHPPGASTYRSREGPVVVLSVNDLLAEGRPSDLEETLLHEACHALDGASAGEGEGDVFTRLRAMLEARGFSGREVHDIPHLVMFAQAEETMRRIYDPDHLAYGDTVRGDTRPLYERSGRAADVVRSQWRAYLDGEQSVDETLEAIVAELEEP